MSAMDNFKTATQLGSLAKLRLRAEVLLEYANAGSIPLTPPEREQLERITAAPNEDDSEFLGSFDQFFEAR